MNMDLQDVDGANFRKIFEDSSPDQSKAAFISPRSEEDGSLKSRKALPLMNATGITFLSLIHI